MDIDVRDTLAHPRERVWSAYRDELPELVDYLPNVKGIECLSREEPEPGLVLLENQWVAEGDIPSVAQRFIKPEMLRWSETVRWDQNKWICSWEIHPAFFTDNVTVRGDTSYADAGGDRTEVHIQGLLKVDVRGVRGVPRLLVGTVNKAVEKLVGTLILPNLRRLNSSLGTYLDKKAAQG